MLSGLANPHIYVHIQARKHSLGAQSDNTCSNIYVFYDYSVYYYEKKNTQDFLACYICVTVNNFV